MNAVVTAVVALLGRLIPVVGANTALIDEIINTLISLFPLIQKEYKDLVPEVQNIIAALQGTDGITAEQWAALDELQAQADDDFDNAAKDEGV